MLTWKLMFSLITKWKRRRLLEKPIPKNWYGYLERNVGFYRYLPEHLCQRFHDYLKIFVWEKHFIGAGGMEVTDEVRVVIAAAAVRMVLNLGLSYYNRLTEIIVYPSHYRHPEDDSVILGEAQNWGTVVLSYEAVLRGLKNAEDGSDTATHEFAHVLDRDGGAFNGTPRLRNYDHYKPWGEIMSYHYLSLRKGRSRQKEVLSLYGATNEAEFFAVATETFFEKPEKLGNQLPDLYDLLKQFYECDPLEERRKKDSD